MLSLAKKLKLNSLRFLIKLEEENERLEAERLEALRSRPPEEKTSRDLFIEEELSHVRQVAWVPGDILNAGKHARGQEC